MTARSLVLGPLILLTLAYAGDGVPPRGGPADYPASQTVVSMTIAGACVPAATAKQIFGEDLDKHGYVVFELAIFPLNGDQPDISTTDFRLHQGTDPTTVRAAAPHDVAVAIYPEKSSKPTLPSNVRVYQSETIGYGTGGGNRTNNPNNQNYPNNSNYPNRQGGVYTDSSVGVGVGKDPNAPPPPPPGASPVNLEQRLEDQSLPEGKTSRPVAGYVFFPKPSKDKRAAYSLMYLGKSGQATLKLAPPSH